MLTALRPRPSRVDGDRAQRAVADDAHEPEHVRAARRVRRPRHDEARRRAAARSRARSQGARVPVPAHGGVHWRPSSDVPRDGARGAAGRDGDRDRRTCPRSTARSTSARTSRARCSRRSPGYRKGATTTVRCIDVAALVAAAVLRKNPTPRCCRSSTHVVHAARSNPRDTRDDERGEAGVDRRRRNELQRAARAMLNERECARAIW